MLGPIVEAHAVDIVDKSFRRGVFRQDQRVVVELDVMIYEDAWEPR